MLSEETQNLLARILLALAEGERGVEEARKEICTEDNYDIQAIFRTLDNNGDNHITPKDIQNYLASHGLEVNLIEVKFFLLFYDQDHDLTLTYGEIFKIIHPGREFPRLPKYRRDEELNVRVDRKLYNLLEKEIIMARIVLALLDDIKHKGDFDIHNCFHALKYYACITGDSINVFLKNCGMNPTAGDIRAIVKRLDINKDEIIDFCEFHAFLGYPDCGYCCPCFPCPNCAAKYCKDCLQDIPCYLLGCDHKGMDSKMRCTSPEHSPNGGASGSIFGTLYGSHRQGGALDGSDKFGLGGEEQDGSGGKGRGGLNGDSSSRFPPGLNGMRNGQLIGRGGGRNLSPEQYKLLQGLTNPEQLNKFLKMSDILDRQNSEEIKLTDNLSLRLSPIRDFDPKEWGCRNCPCNIHSNPYVSCDCCSCDICPLGTNKNVNSGKKRERLFPIDSIYSYSYSYEPDTSGPNKSFLSMSNAPNSPSKSSVVYDKESNKYVKTMANSSDDEENEYMRRVNLERDKLDKNRKNKVSGNIINNSSNDMIYNDQISKSNINNRNNVNNIEENDEEENYIEKKTNFSKISRKNDNTNYKNISIRKKGDKREESNINENDEDENEEEYQQGNENRNNFQSGQSQGMSNIQDSNNIPNWNNKNSFNTFNPNPSQNLNDGANIPNRSNDPNMSRGNIQNNNNPLNLMISGATTHSVSPNIIPNQSINPKEDPFGMTVKGTVYGLGHNNQQKKKKSKISISGKDEEDSEEDLSKKNPLLKSQQDIIDENEEVFLKYLKALIKSEREIEFARRDLIRQPDFNAEDAFRLFEKEGSNVLTKQDLAYGLKLLGIIPTKEQIEILFNKYDLNQNGYVDYDDFFDMVISFRDEDRKEETKRKYNKRISNRSINMFQPRTKELFRKLFNVIIEEEERLEEYRQRYNISEDIMREIFKKINVDKDGICNKIEFANYCLRNNVCKEKKDAYLAFIRLNRNRDGGLGSNEFSLELKSSVLYN